MFSLYSLTTVRAFSFQSSVISSDITPQYPKQQRYLILGYQRNIINYKTRTGQETTSFKAHWLKPDLQLKLIIYYQNNRTFFYLHALALHCCKTHAKINRKMGNPTHHSVKSYPLKISSWNHLGLSAIDIPTMQIFGFNRFIGGFSPNSQWLSSETWACGSTPSYQCVRMFLGWRRHVFTALHGMNTRVLAMRFLSVCLSVCQKRGLW